MDILVVKYSVKNCFVEIVWDIWEEDKKSKVAFVGISIEMAWESVAFGVEDWVDADW